MFPMFARISRGLPGLFPHLQRHLQVARAQRHGRAERQRHGQAASGEGQRGVQQLWGEATAG